MDSIGDCVGSRVFLQVVAMKVNRLFFFSGKVSLFKAS